MAVRLVHCPRCGRFEPCASLAEADRWMESHACRRPSDPFDVALAEAVGDDPEP
jgi:hypothetical protein